MRTTATIATTLLALAAFGCGRSALPDAARDDELVASPGDEDEVFQPGGDDAAPAQTDPTLVIHDFSTGCSGIASALVRPSTASYIDASGALRVAAADEPRCGVDGRGNYGLLLEPASANLIPFSAVPGISTLPDPWEVEADGAQTSTAGGPSAQFPSLGVVTLGVTGSVADSSARLYFADTMTATPGESLTASVFVRLASGTVVGRDCGGVGVHFYDAGGSYLTEIDEATPGDAFKTTPTGAWNRVSVTLTVPAAAASMRVRYTAYCLDQGESFSLEIAAPQLERGSLVTSYIPTDGVSATRDADALAVPIEGGASGVSFGIDATTTRVARSGRWVGMTDATQSFMGTTLQADSDQTRLVADAPRLAGASALGGSTTLDVPGRTVFGASAETASFAWTANGAPVVSEGAAISRTNGVLTVLTADGAAETVTLVHRLWHAPGRLNDALLRELSVP